MAYILKREKQIAVLKLLVEGTSIRGIARITGVHKCTIASLLVRFGNGCRDFLDERLRNLTLNHLECDEIWTFVKQKQGKLPIDQRDDPYVGDQYVWVALDSETKLVPSFAVGKRSADMARRFMVDLAGRLVRPTTHQTDVVGYDPITQISTDGFRAYREAVDLAFGPHVRYGQIVKHYRNAEQPGRYGPPEITTVDRRPIRGRLMPYEICTSHVERGNLTMRTFIKRFARLSLGFSKKLDNLKAAGALHFAYYNFCWRPNTLNGLTPALAAGVTNDLWKMERLFGEVAAR